MWLQKFLNFIETKGKLRIRSFSFWAVALRSPLGSLFFSGGGKEIDDGDDGDDDGDGLPDTVMYQKQKTSARLLR